MDADEREQADMAYAADEEGSEKAPVDAQSDDEKSFIPPNDKRRVKVYELRKNDWFDRGTGYCTGRVVNVRDSLNDSSLRLRNFFGFGSEALCNH